MINQWFLPHFLGQLPTRLATYNLVVYSSRTFQESKNNTKEWMKFT